MPEMTYHYRNFNLLNMEVTRKIGTFKKKHTEIRKLVDQCVKVDHNDYQLSQYTSIDQHHQDFLKNIGMTSNVVWDTLIAAGDRPFQYKTMLQNIKKSLKSDDKDERNQIDQVSFTTKISSNECSCKQHAELCLQNELLLH